MRRRLLWWSAPVALLVVIAVLKCFSVVVAGNAAVSSFGDRDTAALSADAAVLRIFNVIEPAKAHFATGAQAVLDDRLPDAERAFTAVLAHSDACPGHVNVELVQESLGDRVSADGDREAALARYLRAREVVERAPTACFAGNDDPDPQRRTVRQDTLPRLEAKIQAAQRVPPPPPPVAPPPTAAAAPAPGGASEGQDAEWRLHPEIGDPLDGLEQILRDGARVAPRG